jgi:hypothetical protein
MDAMSGRTQASPGSRGLALASGCGLFVVVLAGILVGAYAIRNPNGIQLGAAWPLAAVIAAGAAAIALGHGVNAQRLRPNRALFAFDVGAAVVALLLLGTVAFVLSFNQL